MSSTPEASSTPHPKDEEENAEAEAQSEPPPGPGAGTAAPAQRNAPANLPPPRPYGPPSQANRLPGRIDLYWNVPRDGTGQVTVTIVAATALFAGWGAFHNVGVGIGLSVAGILTVAVPVAVGGREGLATRLPGAALVAALWSVAAIRDSGWVVTLCALAALMLTPIALAPPHRFKGMLSAWFMHLEGLPEAFGWVKRGKAKTDGEGGGNGMRNLRVAAITVLLLVVFGGLFAAADANFARVLSDLSPDVHPISVFLRLTLATVLFPIVLLWTFMAVARPAFDPDEAPGRRTVSRFEIAVPLGALNLLFAAFIGMQLRVYFGGEDYVLETAGLTFAEYARTGFWQLSVVAVLALGVIAVAGWLAPKRARADRWVTRLLLAGLCAMSLVVVASAMFRMREYFETFGLTRLRMWVFTVEIWLAVLFVLVLLCCWKLRTRWLPRAILASGALVLLGLAAVNPDGFIARYNIDRFEATGKLDLDYLNDLSLDAAPAIAELPDQERECALRSTLAERRDRPTLAWNLGHARGSELREEYAPTSLVGCPAHIGPGYEEERTSTNSAPSDTRPTEAEPAEEPSAPSTAAPQDAAFFGYGTCESLDMEPTERMFGTSAKGDYGVEPDNSNHGGGAYNSDWTEAGEPYGFLDCAYYGPGTRYIAIEILAWESDAEAAAFFETDRADRPTYEPYASDGVDSGYIDQDQFKYMVVADHITYEVIILDADNVQEMTDVSIDLVENQLLGLYAESF